MPSLAIIAPTVTPMGEAEAFPANEEVVGEVAEIVLVLLPTPTPTPEPRLKAADNHLIEPPLAPTPTVETIALPTPATTAADTSAQGTGIHVASAECVVEYPPAALGLDPFYAKYCAAHGIPIVASAAVSDAALRQAWRIVSTMLDAVAQREAIHRAMMASGLRVGIIGVNQVVTDMPEHRDLYAMFPGVDWNNRTRAVGATPQLPLLSVAEENVLCLAGNRWPGQNLLVHEFAHAIKNLGLDFVNPNFHATLQQSYQRALGMGLWADTYVISHVEEYWAEGVRLYFQRDAVGHIPNALRYPANTRAELEAYDPELYRVVAGIFGPGAGVPLCP